MFFWDNYFERIWNNFTACLFEQSCSEDSKNRMDVLRIERKESIFESFFIPLFIIDFPSTSNFFNFFVNTFSKSISFPLLKNKQKVFQTNSLFFFYKTKKKSLECKHIFENKILERLFPLHREWNSVMSRTHNSNIWYFILKRAIILTKDKWTN